MDLSLPPDAVLTVPPIPAETGPHFFARFGIDAGPLQTLPNITGLPVTYVDRTWDPQGLNEVQFGALLQSQVEQVIAKQGSSRRPFFVPLATFPFRMMFFWAIDDCEAAGDLTFLSDSLGGPSGIKSTVMKLFLICSNAEQI
ncbi:uncharacterized protein LOC143296246 [Babylonia areolata]|uniref:uncharacterized protein LOC143296246 n=1 Tax=Babylonia areolata TaxID=304850 RepID=UPI003FD002B0